jgi:CBS domain-containing protein
VETAGYSYLEAIRAQGLAGATVFRGVSGFWRALAFRTTSIEVLSVDLPIVIEVVDIPERIQRALNAVFPMVQEGLVTLEDVTIVKYTHRYLNPLPVDRLVSDVMTRDVVSLKPEMSVSDAWQKMIHHEVKAMPVVDKTGKVVGLLTDEDLLDRGGILHRLSVTLQMPEEDIQKAIKSLSETSLTVADVMTQPVITIAPDDSLGSATQKMVHANLKRLPVVDARDHLMGMLSRLDI